MGKYKKTKRPSVRNMTFSNARSVVRNYNEASEAYLRNLVRRHVPDAEDVLACADRSNLLYHTRTIRGVARKVDAYDQKLLEEHPDILDEIDSLPQITDDAERESVDERVCLQLEGCNIPDGCRLSDAYARAKYSMSLMR